MRISYCMYACVWLYLVIAFCAVRVLGRTSRHLVLT
jgi:hypothetical protein